ncbi:MAG: hypothetical protein ACKOXQ_09255 [Hydrogenophaga sp.]
MSPTPRHWPDERHPSHCWDWVTAEDVIRHALAAYTLARKHVQQPPGRRFAEADGTSWATRLSFADDLALLFEMRLKAEGYQLGVCPEWALDAKQLQKWTAPPTWLPDELQHPEHQKAGAQRRDGAGDHPNHSPEPDTHISSGGAHP